MDFTHNQTWPVFYDYIPVYEIWIQYMTVFKRYRPETIFHSEIKGHNSDNNWWILSIIELDLYFMIIYLCMKYESNTPMFSKDIARKPFFVRKGQDVRDVRMYVRTYGQGWCYMPPPPPIINGMGIKNLKPCSLMLYQLSHCALLSIFCLHLEFLVFIPYGTS